MYLPIVEHGEGEGDVLAEAFGIDVVDVLVECVYLVVEYIGIGTANDTAILELTLEYFYSGSDELPFLVEAYFQLDEGGFLLGGLAFAVEQHPDLHCFHVLVSPIWYLFCCQNWSKLVKTRHFKHRLTTCFCFVGIDIQLVM